MAAKRDFKAEYARRIASAERRGLSRSQARGHARHGEASIRPRPDNAHDDRLEAALKSLRSSGNQGGAAKSAGVSPERLRRFLRENALAERRGRQWQITDARLRTVHPVFTRGEAKELRLRGWEQASLANRHSHAVNRFVNTNEIEWLEPFVGQSVIDAKGRAHPLETNPNTLHRIAAQGEEVFHNVYRLVQ